MSGGMSALTAGDLSFSHCPIRNFLMFLGALLVGSFKKKSMQSWGRKISTRTWCSYCFEYLVVMVTSTEIRQTSRRLCRERSHMPVVLFCQKRRMYWRTQRSEIRPRISLWFGFALYRWFTRRKRRFGVARNFILNPPIHCISAIVRLKRSAIDFVYN